MVGTGLGRLQSFLRNLATMPTPDDVLRSLRGGPFEALGMRGAMLWRRSDDGTLVGIGSHAHEGHEVARYATIPSQVDLPIVTAVRENRFIALQGPDFGLLHLTSLDQHLWDDLTHRSGIAAVLNIPLCVGSDVVGALGVVTARAFEGTVDESARVASVADALGLWLTHPSVSLAALPASHRSRAWSLAFTTRQRHALRLVGEGLTTGQIAATLHVSESAVKQDLQLAMSALRTNDRRRAAGRARELDLL